MLHGSSHPGVAGSELAHLLAHLARLAQTAETAAAGAAGPAPATRPVFAERLGQWLGWSGAIALSNALGAASGAGPGATAGAVAAPASARQGSRLAAAQAEFEHVQAELAAAIAAGPGEPGADPGDFGPFRRHIGACQQSMHEATTALRQRLRAALAQRSPAGARVAAIDAALAPALAAQERSLLALVPLRLQAHFERLQRQQGEAAAPSAPAETVAWRAAFRADLARVLHAELAHRLLPARGLLDTLRTLPPT